MNYKVGDKVRMKTYKELYREVWYFYLFPQKLDSYLSDSLTKSIHDNIKTERIKDLKNLDCDRIMTIKEIGKNSFKTKKTIKQYRMEEISQWLWFEDQIECIVDGCDWVPVKNRWELLDL